MIGNVYREILLFIIVILIPFTLNLERDSILQKRSDPFNLVNNSDYESISHSYCFEPQKLFDQ